MTRLHTTLAAAAAMLSLTVGAQSVPNRWPASLAPKGYLVVEAISADLNKDGQADVVLLVKATDQKALVVNDHGEKVDRNRRGLVIAFKDGQGYKLVLQNLSCFSSENEDGGVYFPPELSVESKKGSLLISFLHGRYGYWSYNFRYQNGDFELIGYDRSNNHGPVVESATSINLLTNKVLVRVNTNQEADGGDERFKDMWSKVKRPKVIKLSGIADFDELSVERELGLSN